METLDDLINRERRKVALLEEKLSEAKKYLAALVATHSKARDRLDEILDEELDKASTIPPPTPIAPPATSSGDYRPRARRIKPHWVEILRFIGTQGKSLSDLEAYSVANHLGANNSALRSGLMAFRRNDDYVVTPSKGFYRLTEKGLRAVQEHDAYKETGLGT